jgi:hypothetical protein
MFILKTKIFVALFLVLPLDENLPKKNTLVISVEDMGA